MKRIVCIGNRNIINRIIKILAVLFGLYVIIFPVREMLSEKMHGNFSRSVGGILYDWTLAAFRKNNLPASYRADCEDEISMADALIDRVNSSSLYYGYIKEMPEERKLVVYDPNRVSGHSGDTSEKDSETAGEEDSKGENNGSSGKDETVVSVSGNAVMNLSGTGNGRIYSLESLKDFNYLVNNLYVIPSRAKVLDSELNAQELLSMDMSIEKDTSAPQILIFHTHTREGFTDSIDNNQDTNIVAVGTYLASLLSDGYGYNVLHCTESFDYVNGVWDRGKAYTYAREAVVQILEDNPSVQVVLDVHRDGVDDSIHLVTEVNGKQTAQIMFFNGVSRTSKGDIDYLYNKNKKSNLAMSLQMKLLAEEYFPGFTRRNYIDAYQYNLDLKERSMLIEVGAQTNSLAEAKNAMEPLAALLDKVLRGDDDGGI